MKKVELVFIPSPGIGHFVSTIDFAKCLLDRDDRLSITILVMCPTAAPEIGAYIQAVAASYTRMRYIDIPPAKVRSSSKSPGKLVSDYIEAHKSHVEHAILTLLSDDSLQLAAVVVDLYCTCMIDVAHKFKIPSYLFYTSGAAFLGFTRYFPAVCHNLVGADQFHSKLIILSYAHPVPINVFPDFAFDEDGQTSILNHCTRLEETKGVIINTFVELEPHAVNSLVTMSPLSIYPVGPLLDLRVEQQHSTRSGSKWDEIMIWLDDQPPSSVVFLCFGSRGFFDDPQLEQIAIALERSGQRFLWCIRRPPSKGTLDFPTEYQNIQEALPDGFLEQTDKRGKICGWAPQVEVLAHPAIGGFVSHCGWNSCLESLWYGVPIATWPLYAEQQTNAFQLVHELGLAVELKLDYRASGGEIVMADVVERAISRLMDDDNPVRKRVKVMSEKSRKSVVEGGSSYASIARFIEDLQIKNIEEADI